jgi:hypothetical protein
MPDAPEMQTGLHCESMRVGRIITKNNNMESEILIMSQVDKFRENSFVGTSDLLIDSVIEMSHKE